jgi:hypothetical protein
MEHGRHQLRAPRVPAPWTAPPHSFPSQGVDKVSEGFPESRQGVRERVSHLHSPKALFVEQRAWYHGPTKLSKPFASLSRALSDVCLTHPSPEESMSRSVLDNCVERT